MKKIILIISILFVTLYSNTNSQGWEKLFGDESYYNQIHQLAVNSKNEIFILAENINEDTSSYLFASKDDGKTWKSKKLKYPFFDDWFNSEQYKVFQRIRINRSDDIFIATDSILIRSTENGDSFQTVLDNSILEKIFGSGYETNNPAHIYFDFAPNDDIYVSCFLRDTNYSSIDNHIIKSTNKGNSWEIVSLNTISFVKLSFDTKGTVYTAYPWSAYKSIDTCKTWQEFNLDSIILYNSLIGWPVVLDIDNNGNIYVLSEGNSVIKSTDGGVNWEEMLIGTYNDFHNIESILNGWIFSSCGYSLDYGNTWKKHGALKIYCTDSTCYSIWLDRFIGRFNPTLSDVEEKNSSNNNFTIKPNPATEYIKINVGVRHAVPIENREIQIYNIYGEKIPVEAHCPDIIGMPLRIDVSNFPTGIYFIRFRNEIQKFVVLR